MKIRETCKKLQIKSGNIGEKYLGFPLIIQRITKETFYDIIIKTQSKISNWYNKFLSHAGRCTLINHVLNTIPSYTMSTHKMPAITTNKSNSLNKKFLWNASDKTNKKSPIKWDIICTPTRYRCLGIRNLHILNKAYILKLGWRLYAENNSLWSSVIKGQYYANKKFNNAPDPKNHHSSYWKNIHKTSHLINEACFWIVGNGKNINVWNNKWIENIKISEYVQNIPQHLINLKVFDIINWIVKNGIFKKKKKKHMSQVHIR